MPPHAQIQYWLMHVQTHLQSLALSPLYARARTRVDVGYFLPKQELPPSVVGPWLDRGQTSVRPRSDRGPAAVGPQSHRGRTAVRPQSDRGWTAVGPRSDRVRTAVGPQSDRG